MVSGLIYSIIKQRAISVFMFLLIAGVVSNLVLTSIKDVKESLK